MLDLPPELWGVPALSIRQPWAWAILHAGKDVENRDWPTSWRGPVIIHAGKTCTRAEYEAGVDCIQAMTHWDFKVPPLAELPRGGIVGVTHIMGCVKSSTSKWFFGDYGFVLSDSYEIKFIPCRGALGLFYPKPEATR